jgi:nucleoside-diphosphate-sugar epimerase
MSSVDNKSYEFVVLGSGGWIGSALVEELRLQGRSVLAVNRHALQSWLAEKRFSGIIIYAIGLTADFRRRPYETVNAHVSLLNKVLQQEEVSRLLLLSSTRVYARSNVTTESAPLPCLSSDPSDLYNLSKLLGESLVLQDPRPGMKVVRLSNVVGPGQPASTFVGALLEEGSATGMVTIQQPADTSKNYVALTDVVRLLPLIADRGQHRLYNLGSVRNTSHAEVAAWLERQGARVRFASGEAASNGLSFPPLAIDRLAAEFEPPGDPFWQTLPNLAS